MTSVASPSRDRFAFVLIFSLSFLFFIQDLSVHGIEYRDDEIFYVKSTQEMLVTHNYLSPVYFGENRFQKPILFYWLILLCYKVFGATWFAARFTSVVAASLTVSLSWALAKRFFDEKTALLSALILSTLPLFFRHAKNAVPDMTLNFFIVLALWCAVKFFDKPSERRFSYAFFVSCALGFMIKGFAAIVIPFLAVIVFSFLTNQKKALREINFLRGILLLLAIILPWFVYMKYLHGSAYSDYVLKTETAQRLIGSSGENIFLKVFKTFGKNSLFYLQTILSYFAPWSVFGILGGIPLGIWSYRQEKEKKESLAFMLSWFFTAFLFFSFIFARINHLILVLTTPFAVLLSHFFLKDFGAGSFLGCAINIFRKYFVVFIFASGVVALALTHFFFLGGSKLWLAFSFIILATAVFVVHRSRRLLTSPLFLAGLLIFVFAQAALLTEAGFTAHASLRKFAETISRQMDEDSRIAVGSNDIHEKEFQIYLKSRIEKVATSEDEETRAGLREFFKTDQKAYCLMTRKDFENFISDSWGRKVKIIQEDLMFRKRLAIDGGFFRALLRLDRDTINQYLKEKVILLVKEKNA